MWFEAIIIGIVIGIFRGGRFRNLSETRLRGVIILAVGLIVQLVPFFLHGVPFIKDSAPLFSVVGLTATLIFVIINIRLPGVILVFVGTALNWAVLFFHSYKMPIQLADTANAGFAQMKLAIKAGEIANYMLLADSVHITKYLGKLWLMPNYYPFTKFFGIPDIVIAIGIIWLLQSELADQMPDYGRGTYYRSYRNRY